MDWNKCFELTKEKRLFEKYTKMDSAKAAYFRAKKGIKNICFSIVLISVVPIVVV